ncbi:MAG: glycoside hydrolase family 9 protein [Chitinophagaceae bacterium]
MRPGSKQLYLVLLFTINSFILFSQPVKLLTNHIGYESSLPKTAIVEADKLLNIQSYQLLDATTGKTVYTGKVVYSGQVGQWKNFLFWKIDFSAFTTTGKYQLQIETAGKRISSHPFVIAKNVLEQYSMSDVVYYLKGQRGAGLIDQADKHLLLSGQTTDTIDAHGGWYDATGDYGKHLSHLSFSSYFNPQQIPLTAWSLLKTYELLCNKPGTDFRQYKRRVLDEALYGVDYLVRVKAKNGSFYRSVGAPGPGKFAKDRLIQPEQKSYRIKQTKEQSFNANEHAADKWQSYQVSYRSGGGLSIAALAIAAGMDSSGDFSKADYLTAAENAFAFLEAHNIEMTNDGKENILDDYCALSAATELFKTTHKSIYQNAAEKRALQLLARLSNDKKYAGYWIADNKDRPFFHPSDAGLPLVSLLYYYPYASNDLQTKIKAAATTSITFEMNITTEVNNPFGYSRQFTEDTLGKRKSSFFFPHGSDASPWWQGENARLGSMAAAARLAATTLYKDDAVMYQKMQGFALDQLNWILGLNPFDACMLQGSGHNNPAYGFFGTFEYTNAPGGIVNGITSGLNNEDDIDFNLSYAQTGKDYDWRWAEQWLPHASWYLLAIALHDQMQK